MTEAPPELPGLAFERLLGSGGYSDVYLYRQQLPLRHVAVKVLKNSGLAAPLRSQLTAEANAMAGLADHPNIVPVFSAAVSSDGRPYIVMSYYSRPNLAIRAASERLGVSEVLRIGIQIASAVETAHRAGILHRDIKPANLLINQFGVPGLTDFGIAGRIADEDDDDTGVSVPWTAPEVLYATGPTSVRSDVYALAATLWHLLVGRSPFEVRGGDNSTFELMRRIHDLPVPPTGRADVPESLDRLLRQAMAKDPQVRPASAIDFARGLQAIEAELRLPRTDIVVLTELLDNRQQSAHLAGGAQAPPTVARPASYAAQPPAPPTVERPAAYQAQLAHSAQPTTGGAQPPGTHAAPTRRRAPLVIGAAALVVAGGIVAGFVISANGSGGPPGPAGTVTNTAGTQNAVLPNENVPPGTPKVIGKLGADGTVEFSWTYSAPVSGDTFQYRETVGGKPARQGVARVPRLSLPAPSPPQRVCIEVKVVRADGSNGSPSYSPAGCVG